MRAPAEVPSGWTTIRFTNESREPHFNLLTRLPVGKTIEESTTLVGMPFNDVWQKLKKGEIDEAFAGEMLGQAIPAWYKNST